MGVIDPNAMYEAGFSSDARVTTRQDAKADYWDGVAKEAYNVLGTAAIGQMKANYKQYQTMSNASESQMASVLMEIKKFPKNNLKLVQDLDDLKAKHAAATKTAAVGFGKKRSKAKAAAAGYLQQLKDFDSWLNIVAENRLKAQGMAYINAGTTQATDEQGAMSPQTSGAAENNTLELATGGVHQRLRWNSETGQGEVEVGGEWREDKVSGKQKYSDKAETGTYEEYVARMTEGTDEGYDRYVRRTKKSNAKIKKNAKDKLSGSPENIQSSDDWKAEKRKQLSAMGGPASKEEWRKSNQENRGLVSTIAYSQLKFAREEDKIMGNNIMLLDTEFTKMALKKDSLDWEYISETQNGKKQFEGTVNSYTNSQFKDFFFGGFSYDYANSRMGETAPAYIFMKAEDEERGNLNKDGSFKEGFGPGTKDWEGRLLTLKGQSFVKGSLYRRQVIDQQWEKRKEKYEANQKAYKDANPEDPQWKQEGYGNKKLWELANRDDGDDSEETLKYGGFGYNPTETNGDPKAGISGYEGIKYPQKIARRKALLNFETIPGAHYEYRFELDDKKKEKVWKAYSKTDGSFVRNMKGAEVARIEGLQGTQDSSYSVFNVKKAAAKKKEKEDKVADVTDGAYVGLINADGISNRAAAAALNDHFPDMKGRYEFRERGGYYNPQEYYPNNLDPSKRGNKKRLTMTTSKGDEIWLYDSETGKPVMKDGKPIIVNIGESADKSQLKYINEFLSDYITDPLNNNN